MDIKLILDILYTEACAPQEKGDWSAYNRLHAWLDGLSAADMGLDLYTPGCLI